MDGKPAMAAEKPVKQSSADRAYAHLHKFLPGEKINERALAMQSRPVAHRCARP